MDAAQFLQAMVRAELSPNELSSMAIVIRRLDIGSIERCLGLRRLHPGVRELLEKALVKKKKSVGALNKDSNS